MAVDLMLFVRHHVLIMDLWVKRLHFVSMVAHLQSIPFAPGWLGLSPLLWVRPTPDGGGDGPRQLCPCPPGLSGSSASLSLRAVSSHTRSARLGTQATCMRRRVRRNKAEASMEPRQSALAGSGTAVMLDVTPNVPPLP